MVKKRRANLFCLGIILFLFLVMFNSNSVMADEVEIELSNFTPRQGELLKVTAPLDLKQGKVAIAEAEKDYILEEIGEEAVALVPISYWYSAGEYTLTFFDKSGGSIIEKTIKVRDGDFDESYLTVDEENEEKVRPTEPEKQSRREKEGELVQQARSESSSERLWDESFIWPLEGRITTGFGATRYHNDELANRHNGIDIAAEEGTSIAAANSGKVVLARDHLTTGKTIIIDHGWDVFSSYLHNSELKVEKGDKVERGEAIALVGETGFATGPHLHWSMSIGNIFIDPEDFIELDI